jgi:hypothetical protein
MVPNGSREVDHVPIRRTRSFRLDRHETSPFWIVIFVVQGIPLGRPHLDLPRCRVEPPRRLAAGIAERFGHPSNVGLRDTSHPAGTT